MNMNQAFKTDKALKWAIENYEKVEGMEDALAFWQVVPD